MLYRYWVIIGSAASFLHYLFPRNEYLVISSGMVENGFFKSSMVQISKIQDPKQEPDLVRIRIPSAAEQSVLVRNC